MIKLGNKNVVPFKGDCKPVSIYQGNKKIFSPTLTTKTGAELEFENTYNDECQLIKVYGDSYQEQNRIAVKTGNIIQFDDHKGDYMVVTSPVDCTVTRCGDNLINLNSTESFSTLNGIIENEFITMEANGSWQFAAFTCNMSAYTPSATYTIIYQVLENTLESNFTLNSGISGSKKCIIDNNIGISTNTTGIFYRLIQTTEDLSDTVCVYTAPSATLARSNSHTAPLVEPRFAA